MGRFGRLGNQMFQYACTFAIANKHQTKIGINTHDAYNNKQLNQLVETFELRSATLDKIEEYKFIFNEKDFEYDPMIECVTDGTDLRGYFQSEKYFKHVRNELLRNEFVFKTKVLKQGENFWSSHSIEGPVCSVHVRMGDYKILSDTHYNLNNNYYETALLKLPPCSRYIVFSDDLIEARNLLNPIAESFSRNFVYADLDYDVSMLLMSWCDHHIIANSSFSWWGAWLSENNGSVVSPKNWFSKKGPRSWKDIYCDKWIIV
jgi:hypothetical protein